MISRIAAAVVMTAAFFTGGPAAAFDARNIKDILEVVKTNGASAEIKRDSSEGSDYISGKTGTVLFDVNLYRCNPARTACDIVIYQLGYDSELATLDQINAWNRWTFLCPAYLTADRHPHVWYGVLARAGDTRETVAAQQGEWFTCVREFDKFTDDPASWITANAK